MYGPGPLRARGVAVATHSQVAGEDATHSQATGRDVRVRWLHGGHGGAAATLGARHSPAFSFIFCCTFRPTRTVAAG